MRHHSLSVIDLCERDSELEVTVMEQSIVSQIEDSFNRLSVPEQRRLIERLVHRIHQNTLKDENDLANQLALMAADPEIQSELQKIKREFACAEADGFQTRRRLTSFKESLIRRAGIFYNRL